MRDLPNGGRELLDDKHDGPQVGVVGFEDLDAIRGTNGMELTGCSVGWVQAPVIDVIDVPGSVVPVEGMVNQPPEVIVPHAGLELNLKIELDEEGLLGVAVPPRICLNRTLLLVVQKQAVAFGAVLVDAGVLVLAGPQVRLEGVERLERLVFLRTAVQVDELEGSVLALIGQLEAVEDEAVHQKRLELGQGCTGVEAVVVIFRKLDILHRLDVHDLIVAVIAI